MRLPCLNLAAELGNISKACRIMGFSRDTFYRYQTARDAGGVEALLEVSRKKPNLKNRVEEVTELAVLDFAIAFPAHGQVRASNELRIPATSETKTHFTSALRVSVVFISKPLWTPIRSGRLPSSTPPKRPSPEPTCSMTGFCLSSP